MKLRDDLLAFMRTGLKSEIVGAKGVCHVAATCSLWNTCAFLPSSPAVLPAFVVHLPEELISGREDMIM